MTLHIESKTAVKVGWGRMPFRSVKGLTTEERQAVKDGAVVWFSFKPWHYMQSGFKVVTYWQDGKKFDSREPTARELLNIMAQRAVGLHYENPAAVALIDSARKIIGWADCYPEVNRHGYLTGDVIDIGADGYINVGNDVFVREDALSQEQLRDVDEGIRLRQEATRSIRRGAPLFCQKAWESWGDSNDGLVGGVGWLGSMPEDN